MIRRVKPIEDEVTLVVDGRKFHAERSEPVAVSLIAEGNLVFSRSTKYHRPRGAACLNARCDGCLMRVDGIPNVMTCRVYAQDNMVIESQNVMGSVKTDALRLNDWLFPHGLDHHHMMTRPRILNELMQKAARRIAGIGKLPAAQVQKPDLSEQWVDVIIIGAGFAGLTAALECRTRNLNTLVVDEHDAPNEHSALNELYKRVLQSGVNFTMNISVVGIYDHTALAVSTNTVHILNVEHIIIATGCHETSVALPNSDLPGIFGIRAAGVLLDHNILPGKNVALVGHSEELLELSPKLEDMGASIVCWASFAEVEEFKGGDCIQSVLVKELNGTKNVECDAALLALPLSADYELAEQAGAEINFDHNVFFIDASHENGETSQPHVKAIGSCTGLFDKGRIAAQAKAAVQSINSSVL